MRVILTVLFLLVCVSSAIAQRATPIPPPENPIFTLEDGVLYLDIGDGQRTPVETSNLVDYKLDEYGAPSPGIHFVYTDFTLASVTDYYVYGIARGYIDGWSQNSIVSKLVYRQEKFSFEAYRYGVDAVGDVLLDAVNPSNMVVLYVDEKRFPNGAVIYRELSEAAGISVTGLAYRINDDGSYTLPRIESYKADYAMVTPITGDKFRLYVGYSTPFLDRFITPSNNRHIEFFLTQPREFGDGSLWPFLKMRIDGVEFYANITGE